MKNWQCVTCKFQKHTKFSTKMSVMGFWLSYWTPDIQVLGIKRSPDIHVMGFVWTPDVDVLGTKWSPSDICTCIGVRVDSYVYELELRWIKHVNWCSSGTYTRKNIHTYVLGSSVTCVLIILNTMYAVQLIQLAQSIFKCCLHTCFWHVEHFDLILMSLNLGQYMQRALIDDPDVSIPNPVWIGGAILFTSCWTWTVIPRGLKRSLLTRISSGQSCVKSMKRYECGLSCVTSSNTSIRKLRFCG